MIVRINQIEVVHAEHYSGWTAGLQGPVRFQWPRDTYAFEVVILDTDEQRQPLARPFRQTQLRQLIPEVVAALKGVGEEIVIRLDGPLIDAELAPVLNHLTDARGFGRYAISPIIKIDPLPAPAIGSIRLHVLLDRLAALCSDPAVGLDRSVRLRAMCVPSDLVNPLLEVSDLDDERWEEILPHASFMLTTVRTMQSLHLVTRRYTPVEAKGRLSERLIGTARQQAALAAPAPAP